MAEVGQVEDLTFEQALAELEGIVRALEAGGLSLEDSLALFERGQAVAAHCNAQLDGAELRIKQLTPEGEVPFEPAR
jgi:exodeoxyribonuclease VII small subunit